MVDRERERILRHLDARGVDVLKILHAQPNVSNGELKGLLAGIMSLNDSRGRRTKDLFTV